ncbi:hypothetical protein BH11PLA2_BH11PLA2_25240 [soil metagenome]
MPKPYKLTRPYSLPADAELVNEKGRLHVRLRDRGKAVLYRVSKDGTQYLRPSKRWYFDLRDVNGTVRRVKGFTDLKATEQLAAESERKAERIRSGFADPAEESARRPLADHLKDYAAALEQKGDTPGHVKKTTALVSALLAGAGFAYPRDLEAAKAAEWLNQIRRDCRLIDLPAGVDSFTPGEVAALLGITRKAVGKNLKRRGLTGTGNGKARRIPRDAVELLVLAAARGVGPQQCNHYVRAAKGFTRWMMRTRRIGMNPLETLTLLNTAADVRRTLRELAGDELRRLFIAARDSDRSYRGLLGDDRYLLYLVAAGTGFRANALANLTPADFDLNSPSPCVTLPARFDKSRRGKVQPLPLDVADALRSYLADKTPCDVVWGGTWRGTAAEMLRADLDAAGIAYAVEGPDGLEYADFHSLRHSFLTLGGRSGIDLRTLQELAGHSTPSLTARYTHRRLYDLSEAVEKLPALVPNATVEPIAIPLRMTGTDGAKGVVPGVVPGVVTGGIEPHQPARIYTLGIFAGTSDVTTQTLETKQPGAVLHRVASTCTEWALPGLNRGPSDFHSLALPTELSTLREKL